MALTPSADRYNTTMKELAEQCRSTSELIDHYSEKSGNDAHMTDSISPSENQESILKARKRLYDISTRLQGLCTDPDDFIPDLAISFQRTACLQWLCTFKIMSFVDEVGTVSYSTLARSAGVPEDQLKSVVRMAMLSGIFQEPVPGEITHSRLSLQFLKDPSRYDWVLYLTDIGGPCAEKMAEATKKWDATTTKSETAVNLFFNTELPLFEYFASQPDLTKRFAAYMKHATQSPGTSSMHVVNGFDWSSLGEGHVIDVGGSKCHITLALAQKFPGLRFTVQDLPETIENARQVLCDVQPEMASRITLQSYDFFMPQPVLAADIYLFRTIFHDWPDHDAVKILCNQKKALSCNPKARLLIVDIVLPQPGSVSVHEESILRAQDLKMIQSFNARERELEDWVRLLEFANELDTENGPRLVLRNVTKPMGSFYSILEVVIESSN